ncbi:choice-of-anchor tandem repeat GloVer-containing protein [Catalinimonas alkaloidigena]|nr:choice-of-anchor tandem repeat GloVer-containing protein [Catalinimonas alkaloidigena]
MAYRYFICFWVLFLISLSLSAQPVIWGTTTSEALDRSNADGILFRIDPQGAPQTLYSFRGVSDGKTPRQLIKGSDGLLYGTCSAGGNNFGGTLFSISPDGTAFQVLRHLNFSTDGVYPQAGLTEDSHGFFYGTCYGGGSQQAGTVFTLNADGSQFRVLRHLDENLDGARPFAGLLKGSNGFFYGTCSGGGSKLGGTLFKINEDGQGFQVIHHLQSSTDGSGPQAGLIEGRDGYLYGTCSKGGKHNGGTIFKLRTDGQEFQVLRHLQATLDGIQPEAELIEGQNGLLYGTCSKGGNHGNGTVFSISSNGDSFQVLHHLNLVTDGGFPETALQEGSDGFLYGTCSIGGDQDRGTLFSLSTEGDFTKFLDFGEAGSHPGPILIGDLPTPIAKQVIPPVFLKVHPNPTRGGLTIEAKTNIQQIRLRNPLGQVLREWHYNDPSYIRTVDLTSQSSGLYFLEVDVGGQHCALRVGKP